MYFFIFIFKNCFFRNVNNEVQFYINNDFSTVAHKIHMQKVADFSMSPTPGITGVKGRQLGR